MKSLKLLLVIPNFNWTEGDAHTFWHIIPYNLCLLAAVVRSKCDVEILDAYISDMTREQFAKTIQKKKIDVVGITVMMDQFAEAGHEAARLVKKNHPKTQVLMGGVYVTMNPDKVMADKNIDFAFVGEAEVSLSQFIDWTVNEGDFPTCGVWRRMDGKTVPAERADLINDLDSLPLPAYDLINFIEYSTNVARKSVDSPPALPFARIFSSRGCNVGCSFCQVASIQGRRFRPRSPENVLDEIQWLRNNYGIRSLIFDDDNLYTNRNRAMRLFQGMIDRDLAMPWISISTAVFKLDEDVIDLMAKSGCRYICIAIESGTERVLKEIIRKPVNYDHAKQMTRLAKSKGIYVAANFIIGFPTETWEEIRQTVSFAEELQCDYVKLFHAIPLKQTKLWELCEELNAFRMGFTHEGTRWNTGQIETEHFSANDLTILRAYEWDRINFSTQEKCQRTAQQMGICLEELNEIRKSTRQSALKTIQNNCKGVQIN